MKSWQQYIDIVSFSCIRIIASLMICLAVALLTTSIIGFGTTSNLSANTIGADGTIITTTETITTDIHTDTETASTINQISSTENPSTTPGTSGSLDSSNLPVTETLVESSIKFISDVPDKTNSNFEVAVERLAVTYLKVSVNGLNVSKTLLLRVVSESPARMVYLVPVRELPVGKYELRAFALRSDGTQLKVIGDRFEVLPIETNTETTELISDNEIIASTSEKTSLTDTVVKEESVTEPVVEKEIVPVLPFVKLTLPIQSAYRSFVPVQILTSAKVPSVAVYIQSSKLTQPQFIGSARYYETGQWFLMIDTNQIPNGEYRLHAVANMGDVSVESEKRLFIIYNPPLIIEPVKVVETTEIIPNTEIPKVIELKNDELISNESFDEVIDVERKLITTSPKTKVGEDIKSEEKVVLNDGLRNLVPKILKEYQREINNRLRIYSEKVRKAKEVIPSEAVSTEKEIIELLLGDERLQEISPEAKVRLENEVARMVKNAGQVELMIFRRESSKQSEEEFIKEFSKNIDISEDPLVDVSSPKEFGLVREDLMKIESVAPIIAVDTVATSTTVHTEIRGKALPNSLVTIYIYSSPVMVTVRTDADGTFVYVYEKDLSQGDHEVYVALTTDSGAVAVKSEGFQFVREAEAFGPPVTQGGDILEPVSDSRPLSTNPYFIALSFSILFFGFALMFIGLRGGKKSVGGTVVSE